MLYFEMRPDPVFHRLLRESLETASTLLASLGADGMSHFSNQTRDIFTFREMLSLVTRLLDAHQSDKLFALTEYHLLVLYEALADVVGMHNKGDKVWLSGLRVEYIDFDALIDIYFRDDDFLYPVEIFDTIPEAERAQMGFTDETYGVIHRLKPGPHQIALVEIDEIPRDWPIPAIYRMEEDYPFFDGESD